MAKLVVETESDKLEHAEEECLRILRDIADKRKIAPMADQILSPDHAWTSTAIKSADGH